jgi:hypothetical protein
MVGSLAPEIREGRRKADGRLAHEPDVAQEMVRELCERRPVDTVRNGREQPGLRGKAQPFGDAEQCRPRKRAARSSGKHGGHEVASNLLALT